MTTARAQSGRTCLRPRRCVSSGCPHAVLADLTLALRPLSWASCSDWFYPRSASNPVMCAPLIYTRTLAFSTATALAPATALVTAARPHARNLPARPSYPPCHIAPGPRPDCEPYHYHFYFLV